MSDYIKIILIISTCFFIVLNITKLNNYKIKRVEFKFLLSSLIITVFFSFIFVFKPHHILRAKLNISNLITYLFYFLVISFYFLKYIKLFSRYNYVLIMISFLLFGLANAIDLLSDGKLISLSDNEILEDIFQIFGIVFWLLFFVYYSRRINPKYL